MCIGLIKHFLKVAKIVIERRNRNSKLSAYNPLEEFRFVL